MAAKILIVDDEKDFTELTGTLLDFHGLAAATINDPLLVEKALDEESFDLIVTDIMMPQLDGFELIKKIRAREKYRAAPIIVLSAKPISDGERKFLLENGAHLLPKPFEPLGLVAKIEQILATGVR